MAANNESDNVTCSVCGGDFIEILGQGIESFLAPDPPQLPQTTTATNTVTPPSRGQAVELDTAGGAGAVIQRIINRVLGLDSLVPNQGPSIISLLQQAATDAGRPVGVVIRQASTPHEMALLSNMLGRGGGSQLPRSRLAEALSGRETGRETFGGFGSFEDLLHHILMNERSHVGAPPVDESVLEQLHRTTDIDNLGECSITQETFAPGDVAVILPCGHAFKEDPIVQWLKAHNTCPDCRVTVQLADNA